MDKVTNLAFELHEMLLQSNEFLELKEAENKMLNNEVSLSLINNYHKILEKYSTNKSEIVLKDLHLAKLNMDLNDLIKNYKDKYKNYQILLGKITDIVFEDFSLQSTVDKIIRAK